MLPSAAATGANVCWTTSANWNWAPLATSSRAGWFAAPGVKAAARSPSRTSPRAASTELATDTDSMPLLVPSSRSARVTAAGPVPTTATLMSFGDGWWKALM